MVRAVAGGRTERKRGTGTYQERGKEKSFASQDMSFAMSLGQSLAWK